MKKTLTILILLISFFGFSQQIKKNVDATEFKKLIEEKKYVLIDLRTNDEIQTKGMIKGAIQIDFLDKNAEANIQKLDRNKSYLIYCAGGGRSADAAELMEKLAFKETINLEKGFSDWKNKGFEIEKK
ncbi:rhodanese-like domain-containing protein [Sediminibacterium sp.]|uniref:rhodanese-like domain-containing protein n=1 Tax=Sediminibacterium sp. TaxID=1917865 RepID=UPI0027207235|nr:rhodanese-like domain-containing protein [Sediminibacterium sp.]MDO9000496.1 rhodanese-like domain-containing protein [Bacteroidota bacterium]MDP3146936.1 rhodanese-like domain-containing protein [Bacteroidota bacterium]MDP3567526.1 rhodanese-like domain-containing protein [Sediminibacterium sp.]